ncbi:MAG: ABC transporter ATP-binding protein [bacterium]
MAEIQVTGALQMSWRQEATKGRPPGRRVSVRGITVVFGNAEAVHDVSLSVESGDVVALVGESGSGKTTLCRAIAGILPTQAAVAGTVTIAGTRSRLTRRIGAKSDSRIGYVFQSPDAALNPCVRVATQLTEQLRARGVTARESHLRAQEMLHRMHIENVESLIQRYPHEISGGQKQRVCLAIALLGDPYLLVLDEPTTSLDVTTQAAILELLRELFGRSCIPTVFVTHDLRIIAGIANRVAVMSHGQIVEIGQTSNLLTTPLHPYTRALLASRPDIESRSFGAVNTETNEWVREIGTGCRYARRCPLAERACLRSPVALRRVSSAGHRVRCRRVEDSPSISIQVSKERSGDTRLRGQPRLVARGLTVGFGKEEKQVTALRNVDLDLRRGSRVGVVGESGAGKTTLARTLVGLVEPDAGDVWLDGERLAPSVSQRSPQQLAKLQMVFQSATASLNPQRAVRSILYRYARRLARVDSSRVPERVVELLDEMQLSDQFLDRRPGQLSGGEKQRVAIARALAAKPAVIILDEPVSSLDVSIQAAILTALDRAQLRRPETALLYISHNLAVLAGFADELVVLFRGRVLESGRVPEIIEDAHHPYTEVLFRSIPGETPLTAEALEVVETPGGHDNGGCVFAARCPWPLGAVCHEAEPPFRAFGGSHQVRCHYDRSALREVTAADRKRAQRESSPRNTASRSHKANP